MGGWAARWLTPSSLRPSPAESLDRLVRQLNEAFGAEAAAREPGPASPDEEPVVEEPARRSSPPAAAPGDEAERPPSPSAAPARPGRLAGPGFSSGKWGVWGGPTGKAPCAWGASRSVGRAGGRPPVRGPSPGSRPHGDLVRAPLPGSAVPRHLGQPGRGGLQLAGRGGPLWELFFYRTDFLAGVEKPRFQSVVKIER